MLINGLLIIVIALIGLVGIGRGQDASPKARTLAAALDKTKYKKKEKPGISIEIYIDIKNEPAARANPADYSGTYFSDDYDGYRLDLKVGADGTATGSGRDSGGWNGRHGGSFTLKDARVDGAYLSATRVYESGETRPFEAVFVNRTISNGKNANQIDTRDTSFGIGFIEGDMPNSGDKGDGYTTRVFLEKR